MIDIRKNGVNIYNPVEGRIKDIIEIYVKFYGERYRKLITSRIENTAMFFVNTLDYSTAMNFYSKYYDEQYKELVKKSLLEVAGQSSTSAQFTIEELNAIFESIQADRIDESNYKKVLQLIKLFKLDAKPIKKSRQTAVMSWMLDSGNKLKLMEAIAKTMSTFSKKYLTEYKQILKDKKQAVAYFDGIKKVMQAISDDFKETINFFLMNHIYNLTGTINNNKLKNLAKTWQAILIKGTKDFEDFKSKPSIADKSYIQLFKALGFDHGDNINLYKVDENLELLLFEPGFVDEYNAFVMNYSTQLKTADPFYTEGVQRIMSLGMKNAPEPYIKDFYNYIFIHGQTGAYISPYIDQQNKLKCILVCPGSCEYGSEVLFHELNHVVTSSLTSIDDFMFTAKIGVCNTEGYLKGAIPGLDGKTFNGGSEGGVLYERGRHSMSFLSEIINDYFAVEITKMARENGVDIFSGEPFVSGYTYAFGAFKNFIEDNKEEIKACLMSSDKDAFKNFVGEDNYKLLAEIALKIRDNYINNPVMGKKVYKEIAKKTNSSKLDVYDCFENVRYYKYMDIKWSKAFNDLYNLYDMVDKINANIKAKKHELEEKEMIDDDYDSYFDTSCFER